MSEVFTPRDSKGNRLRFELKDVEVLEGRLFTRQRGIQAKVRISGKVYKVIGRACTLPNCFCDAELKEVKG